MNDRAETGRVRAFGAAPGHVAGHDLYDTTNPGRYQASRRVTRISVLVNCMLAAAQVAMGIIGRSQALIADGVHTLSDISTDLMVLFALKHGAKEADEDHPYGHGRIETAITVMLGLTLIAVALGIAINAGVRLAHPEQLSTPSVWALSIAALTILSKEGLYRFTMHVANRFRSNLLRANAWHHRSDAISSVIVLAGIAGSLAGLPFLDAFAAVGVAMMVARIGWELGWNAVKELVDTALDAEEVAEIRKAILSVDGVKQLHLLRTRRTGGAALVDVHIIVDGTISVSEGHHISETVRSTLIRQIDTVTDVMVHIDPEDDELYAPGTGLPLRCELLGRLAEKFRDIEGAERIARTTLHYLKGRIDLELLLPADLAPDAEARRVLQDRFRAAVQDDAQIGTVSVRYF
jgi:cation diffusion facilitator family transporter